MPQTEFTACVHTSCHDVAPKPAGTSFHFRSSTKEFHSINHDPLKRVAEHLGYSSAQIDKMMSALGDGGTVHARANGLTEMPTPMQAAAASPAHAAMLKQTLGLIRSASGHRYTLPLHHPVDLAELRKNIRDASIEARMGIIGKLAELQLIA